MGKYEKLVTRILSGTSDANMRFDDLCHLLIKIVFAERVHGSHHIFRKEEVEERINLQRDNDKAKV